MDPLSLGLLVAFTTVLILFSGVSVANGLLIVSLERIVPEQKKPRTIKIN